VVLRAAEQLKSSRRNDLRFLVVGDGAILPDLERQASESGLDNVVFAGLQSKEKVSDFLQLSDVCLMHVVKHEHFDTVIPYKIYESMAAARPMVVGFPGLTEQMVTRVQAGLCFKQEDPDDLVRAVDEILDDPNRAEQMGRNGREYVLKYFDYDGLAQQYLEILQSTCGVVSTAGGDDHS